MDKLIEKARGKDPDAFTELMTLQMQGMYKAARAILDNDEDVADAISDTILTCWEKIWQLKETQYFRTWMTRILINKSMDILRSNSKVFLTEQTPEIEFCDRTHENLEWQEALESLDDKYRLVVILYYGEGYKISEISAIMELPESTLRTRLARAREQMALNYYPEIKRRNLV